MKKVTGICAVAVLIVGFISGCGNAEKPESVTESMESSSTNAAQEKTEDPQSHAGDSHEGHNH